MASKNVKPPAGRMLDLIVGYWVSQLVHVAAKLGLADLLAKRARTPADLARATGTNPQHLHRVLRALASVGVFAERADGRFALTPLAATLRGDRPDSMRDFALMMVEGYNWEPWGCLRQAVETGETPFHQVHRMGVFEYFAQHPEHAEVFSRSMASISGTENPAIAAAYDFSRVGTLADVGGAQGHLLAAILERNPRLQGILFDRPQVVEHARQAPYLKRRGIAGRVQFVAGNFFETAPAGADVYLMKYILHDWNDGQCVTILSNVRDTMPRNGRVLAVDTVVAPGNKPQWGKLLDINMLVLTGGRERTKREFAGLFKTAGLKLRRVVPTKCPLAIVEGVRA
jgi:hypothetical protein